QLPGQHGRHRRRGLGDLRARVRGPARGLGAGPRLAVRARAGRRDARLPALQLCAGPDLPRRYRQPVPRLRAGRARPDRRQHRADPPGNDDPIARFLHDLLVRLVDDTSAVEVRVQPGSPTLYEAIVAPDDIGQVVGREGRIVKSIRALVAAAAQKRGEYATFEIVDPQG